MKELRFVGALALWLTGVGCIMLAAWTTDVRLGIACIGLMLLWFAQKTYGN